MNYKISLVLFNKYCGSNKMFFLKNCLKIAVKININPTRSTTLISGISFLMNTFNIYNTTLFYNNNVIIKKNQTIFLSRKKVKFL